MASAAGSIVTPLDFLPDKIEHGGAHYFLREELTVKENIAMGSMTTRMWLLWLADEVNLPTWLDDAFCHVAVIWFLMSCKRS